MTRRLDHLREDRAIRDTAKALLLANIESMKGFIEVNANRERLAGEAGKAVSDNKGALAFLAAAIFLWFGRDEIISRLNRTDKDGDDGASDDDLVEEAEAESLEHEVEETI